MPKITGRSLAEHRERTRSALFGALDRLMRTEAFESISLADIATEAGVGRTSVYNHFTDKEDLLLAFIENATSTFADQLREKLQAAESPVERLRIFVREQLLIMPHYHLPAGPALATQVSGSTASNLRAHVAELEEMLRNILADATEQNIIPAQDTDTVIQLIYACASGRRMPNDPDGQARYIASTEQFVVRAVGAASPTAA